jgi:hypothetical protein
MGVVPTNATRYTDGAVLPNTTYTYQVRAHTNDSVSAWSNEASGTTPNIPVAPSHLVVATASPTQLNLTWADNSNNETGFAVFRKGATGDLVRVATVAANTTSYADQGLSASTTYSYRVRAFNGIGVSYLTGEVTATTLAPPPPSGTGSSTPAPVPVDALNVRQFGAKGDGVANDLPAIQAAMDMAQDGDTVYFPAGTYLVTSIHGFKLAGRKNITLQGAGSTSIIKRTGGTSPIINRLATISNCTNLVIQDLAFDVNGIERWGGLCIYDSATVRVQRCRAYDSNLKDTWRDYDHFWLVLVKSQDVWVTDCHAEDVELVEADNNYRVHILNNVSHRAAGTCAIGWYAVNNGTYAYDYEIVGNRIIDPRKDAIVFQLEENGAYNNTVKRVRIAGNTIHHDRIPGSGRSIQLGYFTGASSAGNVFEDIVVENNQINSSLGISRTVSEICFTTTQAGVVFRRCHVRNNTVSGTAAPGNVGIDLRHIGDMDVTGNTLTKLSCGISLSYFGNVTMSGNSSSATRYAYKLSYSLGENEIFGNVVLGSPTVTWGRDQLQSSDLFSP